MKMNAKTVGKLVGMTTLVVTSVISTVASQFMTEKTIEMKVKEYNEKHPTSSDETNDGSEE